MLSRAQQHPQLIAHGAIVTEVASDYIFTEGPAADTSGNVYFTDQPNDRIHKWSAEDNSVSIFLEPSGRSNGLYLDQQGNIIACADENFEIWSIDQNKKKKVIIADVKGKKLNGPNDLWIDPHGGIYFTDPYYQRPYWERKQKEIEQERVYYLTPDKSRILTVIDDFVRPNGIIGTPDGKTLYVADIGDKKTYSYSINADASLSDKTLFAPLGSDGMTIDQQGNVYLTGDGVSVFNKKGNLIQHIPIEQKWTANVTFGGLDRRTLFITAMTSVYTLKMNVKGAQ